MFSKFLQVAYLVQCRRTNGEKTFASVRLRRQQNVKIGISASRSCSDGKEMLITLVNPNPNPNASLNPSRALTPTPRFTDTLFCPSGLSLEIPECLLFAHEPQIQC